MFIYDDRFARIFGICHYAPPDDGDDGKTDDRDKGGGDDDKGGGETDWKAEAEKYKGLMRKKELEAIEGGKAIKRLAELESANKTELEKAQAAREAADRDASAARLELLKARIAHKNNLSDAAAKRLVGTTEEELEADAAELLATFKPADNGGGNSRPRENLRPGASPRTEPALNVKEVVDKMMADSR